MVVKEHKLENNIKDNDLNQTKIKKLETKNSMSSTTSNFSKKKTQKVKNFFPISVPLNETLLCNEKYYSLNGHTSTIYGLRLCKLEKEDFLLSYSEDRTVRVWSCDFLREVSIIEHDEPVRSACILSHDSLKYVICGSYVKDFPVGIYSFTGSFMNSIKLKGYTYYVDSYSDENKTLLFISTYKPYNLMVYNFDTLEKLYVFPANNYVNSCIVTQFENLLLAYLDRSGELRQYNLDDGRLMFTKSNFGNYQISKWNEKFYLLCGVGYGISIIDINDWTVNAEYNPIHKEVVKGACKFQHHYYGDILVTLGQDQRISVMK